MSDLQNVREFWNTEACGSYEVKDAIDRSDFFLKYRNFRYKVHWYIPEIIPFSEFKNKKVLEIGCGNGADGTLFTKNGAIYTGVDLTPTAINSTKEHFEILGLKGTFQIENSEKLSFPNDSFDCVYSFGVLHHTFNTDKAISEVYRVLKPKGKAIIMLYYKDSLFVPF